MMPLETDQEQIMGRGRGVLRVLFLLDTGEPMLDGSLQM